jgi:hypothetical protein
VIGNNYIIQIIQITNYTMRSRLHQGMTIGAVGYSANFESPQ